MNKITWHKYYMNMVFMIAQKSIDPNTKHGCMVVDSEYTPLSMGYNGPPRGCIDEEIPLNRPDKYYAFLHSEENAIINAARSGISLKGSTFYITGYPCARCFRGILNVGAKRIIYGPLNSKCVSDEDRKAIENMNRKWANYYELLHHGYAIASECPLPKVAIPIIEFIEYKGEIGDVLAQALDYIGEKCDNLV